MPFKYACENELQVLRVHQHLPTFFPECLQIEIYAAILMLLSESNTLKDWLCARIKIVIIESEVILWET